ncbi:Tbc2 translation factor, chloroplastic, partial [Tetrabaena socialis]
EAGQEGGGQQRWGPGNAGEGQWRGDGGRGRGDGEGQWRGDSARGRGDGEGQWRGDGGRGRGDGEGQWRGDGGRGDGQRTFRGPREAMSGEALEARQANNDAVRAAADWRAVAALLESRGSSLDGENITAMLIKVARNGRPEAASSAEFEALVASLYGWVSALVPTLRPKQLATCLYAIAKLELFNAELVAALAERAVEQLGNFNGWEYSNMVWAFGRMNYTPGEDWLNLFVYWSENRLAMFKTVELSNTVGALAKLGHVPGPTWMEALTASAVRQAGDFNNLEYVNLLFGLASLGYTGGADPSAWLEPLVGGPNGAARVAGMRVTDLTRTTWALTQFDWKPPAPWLQAASRAFVAQLRFCLPSDLATISYSLAYLHATPSPDTLKLLAFELSRCWQRLSGDELANVAMSLALWQYRPQTDRMYQAERRQAAKTAGPMAGGHAATGCDCAAS